MTFTEQMRALTENAGVYELPSRVRFRVTGEDRVRWLNGMVTNTVKDLRPGELNYTFVLNAQGRIQGDAEVWAQPDSLLLVTDASQAEKLSGHLDRFIIMDDVELRREESLTALGLAGPGAAGLLTARIEPGRFLDQDGTLIGRVGPREFVVWTTDVEAWRERLAGAVACGPEAVEALRVLRGVPRYGADITERSLPQETGQMRALNFTKGCYLGQEIVERVRSRANLNKSLRVFELRGSLPAPGTALYAEGRPEAQGELTSITQVELPGLAGCFALGTVRTESAGGPA